MYETQPGTAERMGVTAEELAAVTGEQAFVDADLNHDGKLSFDEFQRWYTSTSGEQAEDDEDDEDYEDEAEEDEDEDAWTSDMEETDSEEDSDDDSEGDESLPVSLAEARKLTGLGDTDVELAFSLFAQVTDENGLIDFRNFSDVFIDIITARDDAELTNRSQLSSLLIRLFSLFDTDGNGQVDFSELASGISVLCGGTSTTKVQEAFGLFDFNADGFISLTEFTTYLASVFKTMFMLQPETQAEIGASPEELAKVTAEECFAEADINLDGRLSFNEFSKWFMSSGMGASASSTTVVDDVLGVDIQDTDDETDEEDVDMWTMADVRRATKIGMFSPTDLFETFSECSVVQSNGKQTLTYEDFMDCAANIVTLGGGHDSEEQAELCDEFFTMLCDDFMDELGLLDPRAVASGLSVLCVGPRDAKVRSAFALFDKNQDGFISFDEMESYLTSVFKVLYCKLMNCCF
tara:strand:- start:67 stop:1458 length:1392 start_codon:yes stop_codon:yes gene_type:complete